MNSLYNQQDISFKNFIYTLNKIVTLWNINGQNALRFSKFQNIDRNNFYTNVNKYFKILAPNTAINNRDILCMYDLYQHGIITPNDLAEMKTALEPTSEGKAPRGKKSKASVKNTMVKPANDTQITEQLESEEIIKYKNNILQFVKNRVNCNSCPLQKNGFLIVSTNSPKPANVDIMFIGEGATEQEILSQSHYSHYPEFKNTLLEICKKFNLTYAFVNVAMCNTSAAITPAKLKQSVQACSGIHSEITNTFKARINVLFGESVKNAFNIKGGRTTKLHGQMIGNNMVSIAVDKLTNKTQTVLFKALLDEIGKTKFNKSNIEVAPDDNFQGRIVGNITPDLMLFDIKEINSKLLYIFSNQKGEKVYYIEDLNFPVHIKSGSMSECEYISSDTPDATILLNKHELQALKKMLRENLKAHTKL